MILIDYSDDLLLSLGNSHKTVSPANVKYLNQPTKMMLSVLCTRLSRDRMSLKAIHPYHNHSYRLCIESLFVAAVTTLKKKQ